MIHAVAIDDEPLALALIQRYCERAGGIALIVFSDPVAGMEHVLAAPPDIVFLDIRMNSVSGLDMARRLPPSVCLVLTTAYAEFALEGFELDATDYLHKPFSFDRFTAALDKAANRMELWRRKQAADNRSIVVKSEYQNVKIVLADILYIEAMENYVRIHLATGKTVITRTDMKKMMSLLTSDFIRIHKSYAVPLSRVSTFTRKSLTLSCSTNVTLPVGRAYATAFFAAAENRHRHTLPTTSD